MINLCEIFTIDILEGSNWEYQLVIQIGFCLVVIKAPYLALVLVKCLSLHLGLMKEQIWTLHMAP